MADRSSRDFGEPNEFDTVGQVPLDSRRPALRHPIVAGVTLVGLLLLVGCGGPAPAATATVTSTPAITATAPATLTSVPPPTATVPPITATPPPPTATSLPPTSTAPPTIAATASPVPATPATLLYAADFATWFSGEEGGALPFRAGYDRATGEYRLALTDPARGYVYYRYAPEASGFADFRLDVEARRVAGPSNGGNYGVIFRAQPGVAGDRAVAQYIFFVTADGAFALNLLSSTGAATNIVPRTPSPAIKTGEGTNRLTVICRGDRVTLAINDQTLGTYEAALRGVGAVGIYVANPANPAGPAGMEVAFKDLRVSALPAASRHEPPDIAIRPVMIPLLNPGRFRESGQRETLLARDVR